VTDQPPSQQQPAEESEGDQPAALAPDGAVTEAGPPEPAGAAEPVAPAPVGAEPEPPAGAPEPPAGAPAPPVPTTASAPPAAAPPPPPPLTLLPSGDSGPSGPAGLAAAFPSDRPERAVGAAFAGGLVLALILKRLAR
jgi:hypothetical protein